MKPARCLFVGLAISLSAAFVGLSPAAVAGPCVDLKRSQTISFEGMLTHEIFPGPPELRERSKRRQAGTRLHSSIIETHLRVGRRLYRPEATD
jgi:hypothetical protein